MNKAKIEKLYARDSEKFLAYIRKHLNRHIDFHDERDILQEVFYSLINGIDMARPINDLTGYVYRSIQNKMIDLFRRRKLDRDDAVAPEDIAIDALIAEHLEQQQTLEAVWRALEELPGPQRDVFIQTEIEEKTFQQIADETGASINTLLSQKRYAIKKLREMLSD